MTAAYDANGNLTAYDGKTYEYDWANRLAGVRLGGAYIAKYTYDALNRRVTEESFSPAQIRRNIFDDSRIIEEHTGATLAATTLESLHVYGGYVDEPVMTQRETPGGTSGYFYVQDRRYNMVAVTDSSGAIVERYEYSAFGEMTIRNSAGTVIAESSIGNRFGFTGRRFDRETGLWYYRNRMYSAELGRFLQRDPAGYVDGMNLYAYVKNNPLRWLDPMGLTAEAAARLGGGKNAESSAFVKITRGIGTAFYRAGHSLVTNKELHKGVAFGFKAAAIVSVEVGIIVSWDTALAASEIVVPFDGTTGFIFGKATTAMQSFGSGLQSYEKTGNTVSNDIMRMYGKHYGYRHYSYRY